MRRLAILTLLIVGVAAQASESGEHGEEHSDEHLKHVLAGFIGLTHERRENGLALGVEYEHRFSDRFGLAVQAERTWGDFDFWVVAVPFYFKADRFHFGIGPGVERAGGNNEELVRLVFSYEVEGKRLHYAPGLIVDFVDGEQVFVLGVAAGFGF